jgi:hypothetical protein
MIVVSKDGEVECYKRETRVFSGDFADILGRRQGRGREGERERGGEGETGRGGEAYRDRLGKSVRAEK